MAISITEFGGLLSPVIGRLVDNWPRRSALLASSSVIGAGALVVASAPNVWVFAVGLLVVSLAKVVFDLTVNAWIADHVAYERRARVVGIVETSWAGGLLIGVPVLGIVTALLSWRWAYGLAMVATFAMALKMSRVVESEPVRPHAHPTDLAAAPKRWWVPAMPVIAAFFCMMGAAQCGFVTFGSWLEDDHGATATKLAAVSFGLGAVELLASTSTMRLTDRFGKRRAVMYGSGLMVPAGLALALGLHTNVWLGVPALCMYFLGFEFAIVSALSLASNLVPGRPGTGIGMSIGLANLGRAVMAIAATRLYEAHGFPAPMLLGAGLAGGCVLLLASDARRARPRSATSPTAG